MEGGEGGVGEGEAAAEEEEMPDVNDAELEAAATKIQAAHRGTAARDEVAAMRADAGADADPNAGAEVEAAAGDGEGDEDYTAEEEQAAAAEEAAAVKIQAMARGKAAREVGPVAARHYPASHVIEPRHQVGILVTGA